MLHFKWRINLSAASIATEVQNRLIDCFAMQHRTSGPYCRNISYCRVEADFSPFGSMALAVKVQFLSLGTSAYLYWELERHQLLISQFNYDETTLKLWKSKRENKVEASHKEALNIDTRATNQCLA